MKLPSFKNFPIWAIYGLQIAGTLIAAGIAYLLFEPDTDEKIDAFMYGLLAAAVAILGSVIGLIKDILGAKDALITEQQRVKEYQDLVARATHTINVINGGDGIPVINIQVIQSFDHDRYPIWIYCKNYDQFPIHDLQVTIEDPELLPPPIPQGQPLNEVEYTALIDQYKKGFQTKIGPLTLPPNFGEVIYKSNLRLEPVRGGGYQIGVRWRKGHYVLIIPNCSIEDYLPVFEPPKIFVNGERINRSESAKYYEFDSYIENSIEHSEAMKQRFEEGKARLNPLP
ncbi:hypothetical protein GCM10010967_12000 [Dyadobacter beijingensis]|uniref:Uncharacterized protein n=1 Tax=Dyadobacter beijingensis TaxID=365489 RepID=A0ABQ2HIM5_9BACT|nr:hypothetical protein [Dyadobacter beijingensis]GGM81836.1 hypothetical protein GCM10010967_12000 [Dyadobacter beijingensis]